MASRMLSGINRNRLSIKSAQESVFAQSLMHFEIKTYGGKIGSI